MARYRPFKKLDGSNPLLLATLIISGFLIIFISQQAIRMLAKASIEPVKAFPTAEGFGSNTVGGRFGKAIIVSNLNDTGEGSLRQCVESKGPRTCVFRIGGTIVLSKALNIVEPFITIAGQTAPGGGITLRNGGTGSFETLNVQTHDVIIRYITSRPGPGGMNHAIIIANNKVPLYNIIVDHSSFSWSTDENFTLWYRVFDSTVQWNIISEGLDCSTHPKGCHSKGLLIGGYKDGETTSGKGSENISVLNNLMAHNIDRGPLMQLCGIAQVINNVTYNPGASFSQQQLNCPTGESYVNWINNYHKNGPRTEKGEDELKIIPHDDGTWFPGKLFVKGNIGPRRPNQSIPEENWVTFKSGVDPKTVLTSTMAPAPDVKLLSAEDAYVKTLAEGGAGNSQGIDCDGKWYNRRDIIDTRIVNDVKNGTGKIINSPSETPEQGWVTIASGVACKDEDSDGISDKWEMDNFFNLSHNISTDNDKDKYSDLEEYINGTNPNDGVTVTPTPSATPSLTTTITPTSIVTPSVTTTPVITLTPTPSVFPTLSTAVTLSAKADATVFSSYPTKNYGKSTNLAANRNPEVSSYLQFNLSEQKNKTINKALLRLYTTSSASKYTTQSIYSSNSNNWSEELITYNNRPLRVTKISSIRGAKTNQFVEFNVTDLVRKNLGGDVTFILVNANNDRIDFLSRENASNTPHLVIQ